MEILGKEKNESKGMHILSMSGKKEIKIVFEMPKFATPVNCFVLL